MSYGTPVPRSRPSPLGGLLLMVAVPVLTGAAQDEDLPVRKTDAGGNMPPPIPIGPSHDLLVGQKVFAIGTPFGLDQTLTTGVISALGRQIESTNGKRIEGVIQTDAAI